MTFGLRWGASLPSSAESASEKSPVEIPLRYSQGIWPAVEKLTQRL